MMDRIDKVDKFTVNNDFSSKRIMVNRKRKRANKSHFSQTKYGFFQQNHASKTTNSIPVLKKSNFENLARGTGVGSGTDSSWNLLGFPNGVISSFKEIRIGLISKRQSRCGLRPIQSIGIKFCVERKPDFLGKVV